MVDHPKEDRGRTLAKSLGLKDVYAIITGAMFSSGFFLLPGLASADVGAGVIVAYLAAGVLIIPAMLCVAELATAMPRAGGAYYFLDRSMGPLMGTIGGLGTWLSLVLKSAFALLGMGAYLVFFFEIPVKPLAVALTVVFAAINILGAKEGARMQRWLVYILLGVLAYFLAQGLWSMFGSPDGTRTISGSTLFGAGFTAIAGTIGMVFVSYAGLTKVASVAEEVRNPSRNIPLGMILALLTATVTYVVGVAIMVALIPPRALAADLTPVATVGEQIMGWLPANSGLLMIVVAALAAFASTGNAGILSSSRYPLAMARDRLVPARFEHVGRFGTPTFGVATTAVLMIAVIVLFDVAAVAKLASAFQLLLFGLLCLAVIVMRESRIESYQPGFYSPFYPWLPIGGVVISALLIVEMGWLAIGFTVGMLVLCAIWFYVYGKRRVARRGAIFHCFERLGRHVHRPLDDELERILAERLREESGTAENKPAVATESSGSAAGSTEVVAAR